MYGCVMSVGGYVSGRQSVHACVHLHELGSIKGK